MEKTTQKERHLYISTPLGEDFLLVNRLTATEGLSQLFNIELELLHDEETTEGHETTVIQPEDILGKIVTVSVEQPDGFRYFTGMVNHFSQGNRVRRFSCYYANVVPYVWILTQNVQSRIFQHLSVKDILKKVFEGFEVVDQTQGDFKPRNYCVQYNETDFDFASRLMEEEGIYYFFEFDGTKDRMILADSPQSHPNCPNKSEVPYYVEKLTDEIEETVIKSWRTDYKLQSGKVTNWDFNFQKPTQKLDGEQPSQFNFAENQKMEIYQYPGGYGRKYDGVDKGGGEQQSNLNNINTDKDNTLKVQMQALDAQVKVSKGSSNCATLTAGHRFKLNNHPTKAFNTQYVLTTVQHTAQQTPDYTSGEPVENPYQVNFTCIPHGDRAPVFRPLRKTPKPIVRGSQTAFVVGPAGEEIFTDKYGRVKVQFHWDRDGQVNSDSSCWVRTAQSWAGNKWGMMFIPRIGMEVVVHFLEGDPDQPIVTGCVYNTETMPPYKLPDHKTKSTIKSDSSTGGGGFNEIRIEDKKGKEQLFWHAQKDQDIRVRSNRREIIGNDRHLIVKRDKREKIERDEHIIVERDVFEKIERDYHRKIEGKAAFKTDGSFSHEIGSSKSEKVSSTYGVSAGSFHVKAKDIILEADMQVSLKVGGNFVDVSVAGVAINGTMVLINSGGAAGTAMPGSPVCPKDPEEAEIADNADPGSKAPTYKNQRRNVPARKVPSYTAPFHKPKSNSNKDKKHFIEIELFDDEGKPVTGERYRITLPDGKTLAEGTTDEKGFAKVTNIDAGSCKVTFPDRDKSGWKKK